MTWVPWERAWPDALYGPRGFYRDPRGPVAHFATSAHGIPGADQVLAQAVLALARRHEVTQVVDFACGNGGFAALLADQAPELRVVGVDVTPRPDGLDARVSWWQSPGGAGLPVQLTGSSDTLILAHEWLDVVPCPVLVHANGGLRQVEVNESGAERPGAPAPTADVEWAQAHWPGWELPGSRVEVGRTRDTAYADLRATLHSGVLLTVDYGHLRETRPAGGTLTGFRDGRECPPLPDGSTDVTAHVAIDTLGASEVIRQRDALRQLTIGTDADDRELARTDPPAYLRALAERSAVGALTRRGGLGDFWWAIDPVSRPPDAVTTGPSESSPGPGS